METTTTRPRVTGERELEILDAAIAVLLDQGYDKLTFDLVSTKAKASKATLYRKWPTKVDLVLDAVVNSKACHLVETLPDTGSLEGDLLELRRRKDVQDSNMPDVLGAVAPALHREPELRSRFIAHFTAPRINMLREMLLRAQKRGELRPDADVDILAEALPAFSVLHSLATGELPQPEYFGRVVEQVLIPAATGCSHHIPSPQSS